jgi:aconitate hydratase
MTSIGSDSLNTRKQLTVDGKQYHYFSLKEAEKTVGDLSRLPFSLKILLENMLRHENNRTVTVDDIKAMSQWLKDRTSTREIAFQPSRVLMQDFTGVPAVVDLAAMREALKKLCKDPALINPLAPVDLIIDHSVIVDKYNSPDAYQFNVHEEYHRNHERYAFLRWGQAAFNNFRVVPPGTGICHQVNLEYLGQVVWNSEHGGKSYIYPDTLVGTDSHTTMINGLAILGWGVGGIEAEAAMLGQPISMVLPEVIGFKLTGKLREGATATDLVLTVTQMLRLKGVVGKFVEFYGDGLEHLTLADRATIGNMSPEFGATCGIFPIDAETIRYLQFTGRDAHRIKVVEAYAKEQGLWHDRNSAEPVFTDTLSLDLATVEASLAGPKRPQDKVLLSNAVESIHKALEADNSNTPVKAPVTMNQESFDIGHGDVVIAAITSCTNTSNPAVMLGAGLMAQKALARGIQVKPWVKTSLAPGSKVVSDYFEKAGVQSALDDLGFQLVGYGCTTCIGNSGPLLPEIANAIDQENLSVCAVLSGNRNFEGRIHPQVKYSYLCSPMLVVGYAIAGTMKIDLHNDPIAQDASGKPVYLKEIWPSNDEIQSAIDRCVTPQMFTKRYGDVFRGDEEWRTLSNETSQTYQWDPKSTYVKLPPFFDDLKLEKSAPQDIQNARILAVFGDSITTDHISPASSIKETSPAGLYLKSLGVKVEDFNSYGSRRGNHEVMMRGTFANIRLVNEMIPEKPGGFTRFMPSGAEMTIYDAAMDYKKQNTPLVIFSGREYGTGSSRDWAAKGTRLLGVQAVIGESFERIHRSNLIGMGVLPLEFMENQNRKTLGITGTETIIIEGIADDLMPHKVLTMKINNELVPLKCRIDTADELEYYLNGGILQYVLRQLIKENTDAHH